MAEGGRRITDVGGQGAEVRALRAGCRIQDAGAARWMAEGGRRITDVGGPMSEVRALRAGCKTLDAGSKMQDAGTCCYSLNVNC
jgi:hypothetical protein